MGCQMTKNSGAGPPAHVCHNPIREKTSGPSTTLEQVQIGYYMKCVGPCEGQSTFGVDRVSFLFATYNGVISTVVTGRYTREWRGVNRSMSLFKLFNRRVALWRINLWFEY